MAFGAWLLAVASTGNITAIDARNALVEGSVFFAVGGAFLLVSAILIPALRAIRREDSHPP